MCRMSEWDDILWMNECRWKKEKSRKRRDLNFSSFSFLLNHWFAWSTPIKASSFSARFSNLSITCLYTVSPKTMWKRRRFNFIRKFSIRRGNESLNLLKSISSSSSRVKFLPEMKDAQTLNPNPRVLMIEIFPSLPSQRLRLRPMSMHTKRKLFFNYRALIECDLASASSWSAAWIEWDVKAKYFPIFTLQFETPWAVNHQNMLVFRCEMYEVNVVARESRFFHF